MPLRSRARKEKLAASAAAAASAATTTNTNTAGSASSHSSHELEMAERTARGERNGGPQSQEVELDQAADERTHLTSPSSVSPSPSPSPYATPSPYSNARPRSPEVRFSALSSTRTHSTYSTTTTTSPTSTTAPLSPPYTRTRPRMPYSAMQQFGPPQPSTSPTPIQTTTTTTTIPVLPPGAAPPVSPTQRTSNVSNGSSYTTANSHAQGHATAPTSPRAQRRTSQPSQRGPPVSNTTRYSRTSFDLDPDSDREREREFYGVDDADSILGGGARTATAPGVRARRSVDVTRGSLDGGDKEDGAPLNPPRPFFLAESRARASWSSQDSSNDPASSVNGAASDSERDSSGKENNGTDKAATGNNANVLPAGAAPPSRSGVPRNGPYAHPGAYPHRYTGLSTVTSNSEDAVESAAQETAAQQALAQAAAAARARPPRERAPPSAFKPAALNSDIPQDNVVNSMNADLSSVPQRVASPTGIAATAAAVAATAGSRRSSMESVGARESFARERNADRDVQSSNGHSWTGPGAGVGAYPPPGLNGGYQYPPAPASPPPGAQPMSPMSPMGSPYAGYIPGQQQQQYPGGYAPVGQAMYAAAPGPQGPYAAVPATPPQGQYSNLPPTPGSQAATPRPHNAFMSNSAMARSSVSASSSAVDLVPFSARITGAAPPSAYGPGFGGHSRRNSYADGQWMPPQPPFAQQYQQYPQSPGTPTHELHHSESTGVLPRVPSTFREPFLSPASRPSSSFWTPPTPALYSKEGVLGGSTGNFGSNIVLALPKKEPLPSSALTRKISKSQKPWLHKKDKWERLSWWTTFLIMWLGVAAGAVVCYLGYTGVEKIENSLCMVLDEEFDSFDTNTWNREVSLGGFGNGEFQMTTSEDENLFIRNGQLYIMPTLTSDEIGTDAIFNGHTYNLTGCTETNNRSACSVTSSNQGSSKVVINPVKSARITTQKSASIAFGKVEVRAKLPKGDWLWPAIWMLPTDNAYGAWPMSGEIDIMEARGNDASYPAQGNNFVRSSLNWGPLPSVTAMFFGWQSMKQKSYADDFHTYTLEWTGSFMRFSVDTRLKRMLDLRLKKKSFFEVGNFPSTVQNGSTQSVVPNPWSSASNAAPFDQQFYLILDLAVGGTSGWFPDNYGGKMWFDGSNTAMVDFANAQSTWFSTWPQSDDDRAFRIDSVKMWNAC